MEGNVPTGKTPGKKKKMRRAEQLLIEWTIAILVALSVALLFTQVIFVNATIPSESMEDTILIGDRVLGTRFAYLFSQPQRGDIIIFKYPDDENYSYIKRVIGLPGDTVEIREGLVYINDDPKPLEEEYLKGTPLGSFGPYVVPQDSYFVMGDNRSHSWDSRYWTNTYVRRDQILGKAWVRLYPNFMFM